MRVLQANQAEGPYGRLTADDGTAADLRRAGLVSWSGDFASQRQVFGTSCTRLLFVCSDADGGALLGPSRTVEWQSDVVEEPVKVVDVRAQMDVVVGD